MRLLAKAYGARWVRKTGHRSPMDTPRDNQDRFMKLMLRCPRMVRDLLAHERALLVQQAVRRFGTDTGRRLKARLRAVEDPGHHERVGVLIVAISCGHGCGSRIASGDVQAAIGPLRRQATYPVKSAIEMELGLGYVAES